MLVLIRTNSGVDLSFFSLMKLLTANKADASRARSYFPP
jgi:hypothetical protein